MTRTVLRISSQAVFLAAIVFSIATITAWSQTGSFAASYSPFSGRVVIQDDRKAATGLRRAEFSQIESIMQSVWDRVRPELVKKGLEYLNERDVGGGFRTSNNNIALNPKGYLFISTTSSGFSVQFRLPANTVATTFRTPGPLPSFTDPRVAISCDAIVKVDIFWTDYRMTVTPATLIVGCRDPQGKNITGDLAIGVASLIRTLGGPDFIKQWLSPINNSNFPLSPQIKQDFSKYFDGKVGANTQISISEASDGVDSAGYRKVQVIVKIEDKEKEYVIH